MTTEAKIADVAKMIEEYVTAYREGYATGNSRFDALPTWKDAARFLAEEAFLKFVRSGCVVRKDQA